MLDKDKFKKLQKIGDQFDIDKLSVTVKADQQLYKDESQSSMR